MRIILASASPRRKSLLEQIGWEFEVMVSQAEENIELAAPQDMVKELSRLKAETVFEQLEKEDGEVLVIGADTIVAYEGQILLKPRDEEDARNMLRLLQGKQHTVHTGVTLCYREGKRERKSSFCESTRVGFFPMSDGEIEEYVFTGEPRDKAGAYGIQGLCAKYISSIEGDYNNVVGLPVGRVYQESKRLRNKTDFY